MSPARASISRPPDGLFADARALVLFDEAHSDQRELRWWLLGLVDGRVLLVRYTHRPGGVIRLIGAGYWRNARTYYEIYWKEQEAQD